MTDRARKIARRLRSVYGYSPSLNMEAARKLNELAAEIERLRHKREGETDEQQAKLCRRA